MPKKEETVTLKLITGEYDEVTIEQTYNKEQLIEIVNLNLGNDIIHKFNEEDFTLTDVFNHALAIQNAFNTYLYIPRKDGKYFINNWTFNNRKMNGDLQHKVGQCHKILLQMKDIVNQYDNVNNEAEQSILEQRYNLEKEFTKFSNFIWETIGKREFNLI